MIIISDTNILSSLAAGDALSALGMLYPKLRLVIPPSVLSELQAGLTAGMTHVQLVLEAIQRQQIEVIPLSAEEELLSYTYPADLGDGERESMALAQSRKALLLTNDGETIRYCLRRQWVVVSLNNLLRLFWTSGVMSPDDVKTLIAKMEQVERLRLTPDHLLKIFAPNKP